MTKIVSIILFLIGCLLASGPALAQQSPPGVQSAVEQALGAKEIATIVCNLQMVDLQHQLAEARKQIEELKKPAQPPQ